MKKEIKLTPSARDYLRPYTVNVFKDDAGNKTIYLLRHLFNSNTANYFYEVMLDSISKADAGTENKVNVSVDILVDCLEHLSQDIGKQYENYVVRDAQAEAPCGTNVIFVAGLEVKSAMKELVYLLEELDISFIEFKRN